MAKSERLTKSPASEEAARAVRAESARGAVRRSPRRNRLSRSEKSLLIRNKLFDSAAKVVGRRGYSDAMVAVITAEAGVAQGTFYNYFESRQDLFDQLLPSLGQKLLDFIREKQRGSASDADREERSFRGFFEFLKDNPEFYRILYEAELFAPKAYQVHHDRVTAAYVRVLERARVNGEIKNFEPKDLEPLAVILMGARHYLARHFARENSRSIPVSENVVRSYMKLYRKAVGT